MIQVTSFALLVMLCICGCLSPAWAFVLVILHFALEQVLQASFPAIFVSNLSLVNLITAIVSLIAAARVVSKGHCYGRAYFSPIWKGALIVYAWSAVSLLWTPAFNSALQFISDGLPYIVLFIIIAPIFIIDIKNVRKFATIYLVVGTLVACLVELSPGMSTQTGRLSFQLSGKSYTNPLELGAVGGGLIIAAVLLRSSAYTKLFLVVRVIGFLVGALMCAQSGSRGQLVFATTLAVVFFPIARTVRSITNFVFASFGALVLLAVLITFAVAVLPDRVSARWTTNQMEDGFGDRLARVGELVDYWLVRPHMWPIGVGFDAFDAVSTVGGYSHVLILDIPLELGFVVFGIYIWMIFRTAKSGFRLFQRHADDPANRSTVAFLLAMFLFEFFLTNKQGALWSSWNVFLFMEIIAFLEIEGRQESATESQMIPLYQGAQP
jgi:hypothetical protein